jgi:phosphoglycolate phosphatase
MAQEPGSVAFDLDGTLFDSRSVSKAALEDGFKAFWEEQGEKGPTLSWDKASAHIGLPTYEFFPSLLPDTHKHLWRNLHRLVGRCERDRLEKGEGLTHEGVHEALSLLKKQRYWLGCLSNASRIYFEAVLDGCKLREYFNELACLGESPGRTKADVLLEWGEASGREGKLIYVGDRSADVEAAHTAGIKAVAVTFGYGSREELAEAEAIVERMSDLPEVVRRLLGK